MKKEFLTLALLATVAVGGAFAENVNAKLTPTQGSPYSSLAPCDLYTSDCDPLGTEPCTIVDGSTIQLYGKDPLTSRCTVELFQFPTK